jgi:hypothetical protein
MSMVIQCFFLLSKLTSEFCTCCICVLNLSAVNLKLFVDIPKAVWDSGRSDESLTVSRPVFHLAKR